MSAAKDFEVWTDPVGRLAYLIPLGLPDLGEEGWYADEPGQLPPFEYRIEAVHNPRLAIRRVVLPLAPWGPYAAISDVLVAEGWTPPPLTEDELAMCEHGLSANLCAGPGHYPMDM
jgi:hypothetical protein